MSKVMRLLLLVVSVSLVSANVGADTLEVPSGYSTIDAAIGASSDGDIINIAAGTYTENGMSITKSITIQGQGPGVTIVDAQGTSDGIFIMLDPKTITIKNMTLKNGVRSEGGAVRSTATGLDVTISNCSFENNSAGNRGGAIGHGEGILTVTDCTFSSNSVTGGDVKDYGGAIYVATDGVILSNSVFYANSASQGGALCCLNGDLDIMNCTFYTNTSTASGGGIISLGSASTWIESCTFKNNISGGWGGGARLKAAVVVMVSCVLDDNVAGTGDAFNADSAGSCLISNCVWNGTDVGGTRVNCLDDTATSSDAGVDVLADNGGSTLTCALLTGSPAIDAGPTTSSLLYDQRGVGYDRVTGSNVDAGAYEDGSGSSGLTYSRDTFNENASNNGAINNSITLKITIALDTFATNFTATDVTVNNLPSSLVKGFTRTSGTLVEATLTGIADSHASSNNVTDLEFIFADTAFTGGDASVITDSTKSDLKITYIDVAPDPQLTYNGTGFSEAVGNDGSIDTSFTIDLLYDTFSGGLTADFVASNWVTLANVPSGLTVALIKTGDEELTASISGNATAHNSSDNVSNLTFDFQDGSLVGGDASSLVNDPNTGLTVSYINPTIAWSGSFSESADNDGSIDNSSPVTATLTGDTFTGADASDMSGKFTPASVPDGLTVVVTKTSDTVATLTLTGSATDHDDADDTTFEVTFGDTAFTAGLAARVTNYVNAAIAVDFLDPYVIYYVATNGTDDGSNDGLSAGTALATITNALAQPNASIVEILAGTFTETNIIITTSCIIRGQGVGSTIVQGGATPQAAGVSGGIFRLKVGKVVTIEDMTLRNGVNGWGGAISIDHDSADATIQRCSFENNYAVTGHGGAINKDDGYIEIIDCNFKSNSAVDRAGAVHFGHDAATILNSTFDSNSADFGGAIYFQDGKFFATNLVMKNCTFYNNHATDAGGAFFSYASLGNNLLVENCTFKTNRADSSGGAIYQHSDQPASSYLYLSCVMDDNSAGLADYHTFRVSGSSAIMSNSVWNGTAAGATRVNCLDDDATSGDAMVDDLADNGGPTWTCALIKGSPAIDAGPTTSSLLYDQRGDRYDRIVGLVELVDAGAFEFGSGPAAGWVLIIR